jgi:hypothetical protein
MDLYAELGHIGEARGVIRFCEYGGAQVLPDLIRVYVEGRGELDVTWMITAKINVHEAGHEVVLTRVAVEVDTLNERGGAVAHADDGYACCVHAI